MLYRSEDPPGRRWRCREPSSIPKGTAPRRRLAVITWTHGTTGLAAVCGPSRDTPTGPEHPYIADIQALLDQFVAKGYAVVATDYRAGRGRLPHLPARRAQRQECVGHAARRPRTGARHRHQIRGDGAFPGRAGGSVHGGRRPVLRPEFQLVGNVAMAPGTHIADRLAAVRASDKVELALPYVLYVLQSYSTTDKSIDVGRILTRRPSRIWPNCTMAA